jgi:hypothetical protein
LYMNDEHYYRKYMKYKYKYLRLKHGGDGDDDNVKESAKVEEKSEPVEVKFETETKLKSSYYHDLEILKNTIIQFMTELDCCRYEINIPYGQNMPEKKKKYIQLLTGAYNKMVTNIRKKTPAVNQISNINNDVESQSVEDILKSNYGPIIDTIFTEYISFLEGLLVNSRVAKVPIYILVPIARDKNNDMPRGQFGKVKNSREAMEKMRSSIEEPICSSDEPIKNCYLLLGKSFFSHIKDNINNLEYTIGKIKPELTTTIEYISTIGINISFREQEFNQLEKKMETYNKSLYSGFFSKKNYGDMKIYDMRQCPIHVENPKQCKPPCIYYKKTKGCTPKY